MLRDKLNEMKAASAAKVPPQTLAIMQQAKETLAASGILDKCIKVGDKLPEFTLNDSSGKPISLMELRQQGPVLLTIYRGIW